jgi:hypothetical protein
MNLTLDERQQIFDKVWRLVEKKHFDPGTALRMSRYQYEIAIKLGLA